MIHFKLLKFNSVQIQTDSITLQQILKGFTYINPLVYMKKSLYVEPYYYSIGPLGTFKLGLIHKVFEFCKTITNDITIDPAILKKIAPIKELNKLLPIIDVPNENFKYRDYQKLSISKYLEYGRGISVVPTGGGKSLIIAGLFHNLLTNYVPCEYNEHYLLLVPNRQLVDQMYDDFVEQGITNIQKFCSGNKDTGHIDPNIPFIVTNVQWIEEIKNKKKLEQCILKVVFCDECHCFAHNKSGQYIDRLQINYRFGCTATLPSNDYAKNDIIGTIGPIVYEETFTELREQGFLSKLNLVSLQFNFSKQEIQSSGIYIYDDPERDSGENFISEKKFFYENDKYLLNILRIISQLKGNTLVLFDNTSVGNKLFSLMSNTKYKDNCRFVDGSIKIDIRNDIKIEIETRNDIILFAQSKTFSTGINLKNLHNITFVLTSKAPTKILQSIGRGLRLHESKDSVNILDISSNLKYSRKHRLSRQKLFKEYYENDFDHTLVFNANANITKMDTDSINKIMIEPKLGDSSEK